MSVLGHGVEICTTATRPASAPNGTLIFDTDVSQLLVRVGGSWVSSMTNQAAGGDLTGTYPNPTLGNVNYISGISSLSLRTGGFDRIIIDSSGRVTTPYVPAFSGYRDVTPAGIQQDPWVANIVQVNNGSCYNSSNGRFTIPVNGFYLCTGHWIGYGGSTGYAGIKKNGSVYQFTHWNNANDPWNNIAITAVVPCVAGDYITFYVSGGSSPGAYGSSHNGQSVYLIG